MNKQDIIKMAAEFTANAADCRVGKETALREDLAGMKMFEEPIFAFGAAADENFRILQKPGVVGEHFLLPRAWLPEAKSVISFFLPFSERVKKSNASDMAQPSSEWLHARIEGQAFLANLCRLLQTELIKEGYKTIIPSSDERFCSKNFSSNWSERHVAFILGLGTFGLSKGLITKKGVAGRFGSLVTELELAGEGRSYADPYEYCSMCGACAKNCPAMAISIENGKDHKICSAFLDETREKYKPRYGCGKCQIKVPCESGIPRADTAKRSILPSKNG